MVSLASRLHPLSPIPAAVSPQLVTTPSPSPKGIILPKGIITPTISDPPLNPSVPTSDGMAGQSLIIVRDAHGSNFMHDACYLLLREK